MLRVGTAGWSYPDWEGIVYAPGVSTSREALALCARLFETLEINATFYRPPSPKTAEGWARRTAGRPTFRFTAKLWRGFTHDRDADHPREELAFKEGIAPLAESGRLGAILIQFPHSFHNSAANRAYLDGLLDRFAPLPLVVEVRHDSWHVDEFFTKLSECGVGFCNVDQPAVGRAAPPSAIMAGAPGYVRLHGRNRENWFRDDAGRDARYDYLYSHDELSEWADRIRLMQGAARGGDVYIIANNHYRGQAAVNALELRQALDGGKVETPASLIETYPRLAAIARTGSGPGLQRRLPL